MNLFDSTLCFADQLLPKRHQKGAAALLCLLGLLALLPDSPGQPGTVILQLDVQGKTTSEASPPVLTTESAPAPLAFAPATVPLPPPLEDPRFVTEVKPGDNLSLIFARAGLSARDVHQVINSSADARILSKLYPNYQLAFDISGEGGLQELEVLTSPLESHVFRRNAENGFDYRRELREPELRQVFKAATIKDSLFLSAQRGGISAALTMELAGMFGGVIDFMLDIREGDGFNVLYEEKYYEGGYVGNGAILAAQFTNQGRVYTALRYENSQGGVEYYNPEGESMRKAFLRNPVDFTRISSDFNLSRRHPILNTIRAHKGTDYAAPTGTPVVATSNGVVTWAARNGSFGKLVVIQHDGRFESKYAHLSDYAKGIRKGTRVRQGQVIGFVGATGGATGPHLHYEFLMDGVHRNWRAVHDQLPKAVSIPASELALFKAQSETLLALLDSHSRRKARVQTASVDQEQ